MFAVATAERFYDESVHSLAAPERLTGRGDFASADQLPELQFVRRRQRQLAQETLAANMQRLRDGEFEQVPIPVDVTSTAREVVDTGHNFGFDSPEYADRRRGLVVNNKRLLAEAWRKNGAEYFEELRYDYDPVARGFYFHGTSLGAMTANALTPIAEPEEQDRRVNEAVEEATYVGAMTMSGDEFDQILTISQCTAWAHASHRRNPKGSHGGYVPSINKTMLRGVRLDRANNCRYEEQLGIPGIYIEDGIFNKALRHLDILADGTPNLTVTEIHGTQIMTKRRRIDGVFGFAELLDQLASQEYGVPMFLGMPLEPGQTADYEAFRSESRERQARQDDDAEILTEYQLMLAEKGTDPWAAEALVEKYVTKLMFGQAAAAPEAAAMAFDQATADGLHQVQALRVQGLTGWANELQARIEAAAPPSVYCGAGGNCGIEGADVNSADGQKAIKLGLKAKNSSELLHDTARQCPNCNEFKVFYDLDGNKVCTSCDFTEIDGTIGTGTNHEE